MGISERLKEKIRPIVYSGLIALTLGCSQDKVDTSTLEEKSSGKSFDNFDKYGGIDEYGILSGALQLSNETKFEVIPADLDGDGDLDLITYGNKVGIVIYENKIPQKKRGWF